MIGLLEGAAFNGHSFSPKQAQKLISQAKELLDRVDDLAFNR
jgi:hypothetical protein